MGHFEWKGQIYIGASGHGIDADFFRFSDFSRDELTSKSSFLVVLLFIAKLMY